MVVSILRLRTSQLGRSGETRPGRLHDLDAVRAAYDACRTNLLYLSQGGGILRRSDRAMSIEGPL